MFIIIKKSYFNYYFSNTKVLRVRLHLFVKLKIIARQLHWTMLLHNFSLL